MYNESVLNSSTVTAYLEAFTSPFCLDKTLQLVKVNPSAKSRKQINEFITSYKKSLDIRLEEFDDKFIERLKELRRKQIGPSDPNWEYQLAESGEAVMKEVNQYYYKTLDDLSFIDTIAPNEYTLLKEHISKSLSKFWYNFSSDPDADYQRRRDADKKNRKYIEVQIAGKLVEFEVYPDGKIYILPSDPKEYIEYIIEHNLQVSIDAWLKDNPIGNATTYLELRNDQIKAQQQKQKLSIDLLNSFNEVSSDYAISSYELQLIENRISNSQNSSSQQIAGAPSFTSEELSNESTDISQSVVERYLEPFVSKISIKDYNRLVNAYTTYFETNSFPNLTQPIEVGKINKKRLGWALKELYFLKKHKPITAEYLLFARDNISVFADLTIDTGNIFKSQLYKYFTTNPPSTWGSTNSTNNTF